jgi:hypothetical protein
MFKSLELLHIFELASQTGRCDIRIYQLLFVWKNATSSVSSIGMDGEMTKIFLKYPFFS